MTINKKITLTIVCILIIISVFLSVKTYNYKNLYKILSHQTNKNLPHQTTNFQFHYVGENLGLIISDKFNFYVNSLDTIITPHMIKDRGVWEPMQTHIFKELSQNANVIFDVGSHLGYYTILAAKYYAPNSTIYAFEANPDQAKIIEKNIAANVAHKDIKLINSIVTNHPGEEEFAIHDANRGASKMMFDRKDPSWSFTSYSIVKLPAIKLDDIYTKETPVDIIRMDIEGAEFSALEGASNILDRSPEVIIIMEANKSLMTEVHKTKENILAKIKKYTDNGYKLWSHNNYENKEFYLSPITAEEFTTNDYGDVVMSKRDILVDFPHLKRKTN